MCLATLPIFLAPFPPCHTLKNEEEVWQGFRFEYGSAHKEARLLGLALPNLERLAREYGEGVRPILERFAPDTHNRQGIGFALLISISQ